MSKKDRLLLAAAILILSAVALVCVYVVAQPIPEPDTPPEAEYVTETIAPETSAESTEEIDIIDTAELNAPDPMDEYSLDDIELAARVVHAEAGNQDLKGKRLVAAVILNRIDSEDFPDTVKDVVFQRHQFSTTTDGALEKAEKTVTGSDYAAVELEIRDRTDPDIMYFTAGGYNPSGERAYKYGDHYFCYGKENRK